MIWKQFDVQAGTGPSVTFEPKRQMWNQTNTGVWGLAILSGAATVLLEGAFDPNGPWYQIDTASANSFKVVTMFPHMRMNATANTGTVSAWFFE